MKAKSFAGLVIAIVALFLLSGSFYIVSEGQNALKLRLGKLVVNSDTGQARVYKPGLHFKIPFVNTVRTFDVRLQDLSVDQSRIYTAEQKSVLVDYYARWRIDNLALFYTRTGGRETNARLLLTQKINDALRAAFGKRVISEVVAGERLNIMNILKDAANASAKGLGITVIDVRIKGIELPAQVRDSVYQRMTSERQQVATKHRAQGKAKAEEIRAATDAHVVVTLAQAQAEAQKIRASGDSKAATIYADVYDKNPSFYAFYRSLLAYKEIFTNKSTVMVLKPDSDFFKYFNHTLGEKNK